MDTMLPVATDVCLRPRTDADTGFLRVLYGSTRERELGGLGWTPEQLDAFLDLQFRAREAHYRREYPSADDRIVVAGGAPTETPIGRLEVDRTGEATLVVDLALAPSWRGQGIGTRLLQALIDEATASGRGIELHVEEGNPAERLYRRLGFVQVGERPPYRRMRWQPAAGGSGDA